MSGEEDCAGPDTRHRKFTAHGDCDELHSHHVNRLPKRGVRDKSFAIAPGRVRGACYKRAKGEKEMIAKKTGQNFDPCPAGNHIARCIQLIDLGTHERNFKGRVTHSRRVKIVWELPDEQKIFKEENGMQPYVLSQEYTLSLSDKATLKKDLESWRGKSFSPDELEGFDMKNILDKCCMLNVIHKQKEGSSDIYANVSSVASMPKGVEAKQRINPLVYFSLDEFDEKVFSSLPETVRAKIQLSPEYQRATSPGHFDTTPPEYSEEDIPF